MPDCLEATRLPGYDHDPGTCGTALRGRLLRLDPTPGEEAAALRTLAAEPPPRPRAPRRGDRRLGYRATEKAAQLDPADNRAPTPPRALAGARSTARLEPADLDVERIAEELQIMQSRERLDAEAQIMRVIEHLLKLRYATEHEPRSRVWWRAVHGARSALDLFETPSRKPKLAEMLPEMYERARELAKCELQDIGQISLAESIPHACPDTFEQILDEDRWPVWADPPEPAG
ncbi:MAG TPA: DUF29 family protein [Geminicoccaceae bacterium]|nr:DUF29 family protein [Geminicoccaceae bacterium]